MPAGGFKTFIAGSILDEDDINDYLMQGVLVFAGTAARGSAIGTAVEGQFAFLKDTDTLTYNDGSQWVQFSTSPFSVQYLVIAGGGGSLGGGQGRGGGGAGGYRCNVPGQVSGAGGVAEPSQNLRGTYTITVGAGGATGAPGSNSVFGPITSTGGGFGSDSGNGTTGGSGGGAGIGTVTGGFNGGAGTVPMGFAGGTSQGDNPQSRWSGGGGGGAAAVGTNGNFGTGGNGGAGASCNITGSGVTRGGGGAARGNTANGTAGAGGGGAVGSGGTANTGGGGGGGATAGGSGIVIFGVPTGTTVTFSGGVTQTNATVGSQRVYTVTATSTTSETVTIG